MSRKTNFWDVMRELAAGGYGERLRERRTSLWILAWLVTLRILSVLAIFVASTQLGRVVTLAYRWFSERSPMA